MIDSEYSRMIYKLALLQVNDEQYFFGDNVCFVLFISTSALGYKARRILIDFFFHSLSRPLRQMFLRLQ